MPAPVDVLEVIRLAEVTGRTGAARTPRDWRNEDGPAEGTGKEQPLRQRTGGAWASRTLGEGILGGE